MANLRRHSLVVEIDWRNGTEGYAFERIRTPLLDYQDLLIGMSGLDRGIDLFGGMSFPNTTIQLANRDVYFSTKLATVPHRGTKVRIKCIPPLSTYSDAVTIFSGSISKMKMANGVVTFELLGNNFEQIFNSALSDKLPVITHDAFPNLPESQVPAIAPLIYGRVNSPFGEDLADPQTTGAIPAYLVDTEGTSNFEWSASNASANKQWKDICWSEELAIFVAVSGGAAEGTSRVMTSPDGTTWTTRTAIDGLWQRVIWAKELALFVAVGDASAAGNGVMTSPDGTTWTNRTPATNKNWKGLCWAPEIGWLVAVASSGTGNRVMTSPNGITWTSRSSAADDNWTSVAWAPELPLFISVSSSGTIMSSQDAVTWALRTSPAANAWQDVIWAAEAEIYVAVGSTGTTNRAMVSGDGITWLLSPLPVNHAWRRISWSPDFESFAVVSIDGTASDLVVSEDAINWDSRITPVLTASAAYSGVAWSPTLEKWVAVGGGSTNAVLNSPSGLGTLFKYVVGSGLLAGDNGDEGNMSFITHYGTRIGTSKQLSSTTIGGKDVSLITFAKDQRDTDRPSEQEIAFYGSGIRSGIAGSAPILNPVTAKIHFLENYAGIDSDDIDADTQADAEAAAEEQHLADDETVGVAPASLGMSSTDMTETVRSVIESFDRSFGMVTFPTRDCKIGTLIHTLGRVPYSTEVENTFRDVTDILKDSLSQDDMDEVATTLHLNIGLRQSFGQHGDPSPGQQVSLWVPNYEIPSTRGKIFPGNSSASILKTFEMPYCRRVASAINIARMYSEYLRPDASLLTFSLPITYFDQIDIGDYFSLEHWQGINESGSGFRTGDAVARITGIKVDGIPMNPFITVTAFMRAPGLVYHDNFDRETSTDLDGPWNIESESASTALAISAASLDEAGTSFNQDYALTTGSGTGLAIPFSADDFGDDQMIGIEFIRRVRGNRTKVGVGVRMSGVYTSATGYIALLEETADDTVYVRLYRCSGTNLASSPGTLIGEYLLTTPELSTSTWENQGDILELRAEGQTIEVWYFSDINQNNKGRILQVTDGCSISSGQVALIARGGNGTRITNAYIRSYSDASYVSPDHSDCHADISHSDVSHTDTHTDSPYVNLDHTDTHSDTTTGPSHSDSHGDAAGSHGDEHADISDIGHFDEEHGDLHFDHDFSFVHSDSHSDTSHGDDHVDSHTDDHADTDGEHTDTHSDSHADGHTDSHTDSAHTDAAHGDSHTDTTHTDVSHTDSHTDA